MARNANPEQMDQLADKLCPEGDGGAYGALASAFDRARSLDASTSMTPLAPLLGWLMDTADQLRDKATLLRGDTPTPDFIPTTPEQIEAAREAANADPHAAFEVLGQWNLDEFVTLARSGELTDEDIQQMSTLLGAFSDDPNFAAALVDELGVEEFLALSQEIQDRAGDMDDPDDADRLREDMGHILTGAFRVPGDMEPGSEEYQDWTRNTPQGRAYLERLQNFGVSEHHGEAAQLVDNLIDSDDLSVGELEQLNEFLGYHSDNLSSGGFHRELMSQIGPEGLVELAETLPERISGGDEELRPGYQELQQNIANSLANATTIDEDEGSAVEWYTDFMAEFEEVGRQEFDVGFSENEVRGYQMLLNLMEEGSGYSSPFLSQVTDDLRELEDDEGKEFWVHYTDATGVEGLDLEDGELERLALDPMNSVLGIMGQHPAAATDYFSDSLVGDERLDWMIERDWETHLFSHVEAGTPIYVSPLPVMGPNHQGFGDALEAATTGHPAGSDEPYARTPDGDQLMVEVIERFTEDGPFRDIRPQLGQMGAAYMGEIQYELSEGIDTMDLYEDGPPLLDDLDVQTFIAMAGRHPDGYAALVGAQQGYTTLAVDHALNAPTESEVDPSERLQNAVVPGAVVQGILADARASAVFDAGIATDAQYNGNIDMAENVAGLFIDETIGNVPIAGGPLSWGADQLSGALGNHFRQDNSQEYYDDANDLYTQGREDALASALADVRVAANGEHEDTIDDFSDSVRNEYLDQFDTGFNWEN